MKSISLLNWNLAWRSSKSRAGSIIKDIIKDYDPDIICLTEAYDNFLSNGYMVSSHPDYGYARIEGRRKVLLWAKTPWTGIDNVGSSLMPAGRFIGAATQVRNQTLNLAGVCIPWKQAHVTTGRKDRAPWEDHMKYLEGLEKYIQADDCKNRIIVGDFNQTIPKTKQPNHVYEKLLSSIKGLSVPDCNAGFNGYRPMIDHVLTTPDILIKRMEAIPADFHGEILSDHNGIYSELVIPA